MNATPVLDTEREGPVRVLALARPSAGNAINQALHEALVAQLAAAGDDEGVGAVVLAAAGERTFSAGADLKEFAELEPSEASRRRRALLLRTLLALADFRKPLVAAVQAKALGAGCMVALLADHVIASEAARFAMPEIRHGMPSPIGITVLAARAGYSVARRLVQGGEAIDAQEARTLGLVDEVVDVGSLRSRAIERARALAAHLARAFEGNKQFLNARLRRDLGEAAAEAERLQVARGD